MRNAKWILLLCLLLVVGAGRESCRNYDIEKNKDKITVTAPFNPQYSSNENPQSSVDLVASLCGIDQFRQQYQTSGKGQKIALIDSGIDLGHIAFQKNMDGSEKVVTYRDYTEEGLLHSQAVSCHGNRIAANGNIYRIDSSKDKAFAYRIAFLDLETLQPRRFLEAKQELAILLVATKNKYDHIYIDTNQNFDFSDEAPIYCYQAKAQTIILHNAGYDLNIALTDIAEDGTQLHLTADTLGHGTFLAGILAANGEEYQGLAPQAQLYIYKIFNRDGESSQLQLADAIRQAILDKVDGINLSLSIPQEEGMSTILVEALQQAKAANIPVIAAAGNYGPGKNTIAYPARAEDVIGVGSYISPEMYHLDKKVEVQVPFVTDYSGRGMQGGRYAPLLIAPAGMISTVPGWYTQKYLYDYGTSISAAIITAAVIHVQEAAGKKGIVLSTEEEKNLLAQWAKDIGFPVSEQGYGALQLKHLPKDKKEISQRHGKKEETIVYTKEDLLQWHFSILQGWSKSWNIQVPRGSKMLSAILQIDQQVQQNEFEHLIALGRGCMRVYDPTGKLVEETPFLGASYNKEIITKDQIQVKYPKEGEWEIVITSADDLSQYNHLETMGSLQIEIK